MIKTTTTNKGLVIIGNGQSETFVYFMVVVISDPYIRYGTVNTGTSNDTGSYLILLESFLTILLINNPNLVTYIRKADIVLYIHYNTSTMAMNPLNEIPEIVGKA